MKKLTEILIQRLPEVTKTFSFVIVFSVLFFFISCEDEITLDFIEYERKIVVEGSIEQGDVARVFLTRSTGFFEEITNDSIEIEYMGNTFTVPEFLYNTLVLNAHITVSNGVFTDTLTLSATPYVFPYVYYVGSEVVGEVGGSYQLYIEVDDSLTNGKVIIEGMTSIPEPVPLDSLWFEFDGAKEDSMGYIYGTFNDPVDQANYYRIFTKTVGRDSSWVHPWNSIWHDRNINGEEDVLIGIYHGDNSMDDMELDRSWYFHIGENVKVKLCTIDRSHFDFWNSYQQNAAGANPFAEPVQLNSNIIGGLGVWGGYSVSCMDFEVQYIEPDEEKDF